MWQNDAMLKLVKMLETDTPLSFYSTKHFKLSIMIKELKKNQIQFQH